MPHNEKRDCAKCSHISTPAGKQCYTLTRRLKELVTDAGKSFDPASVIPALDQIADECKRYTEVQAMKENQTYRKEGPCGWLKILQVLDPAYPGYDGGLHGARVVLYPPQTHGIQCRGGKERFVADAKFDGMIIPWEDQISHNRRLLGNWKRGDRI